ncbi:ABC transporter permease [Mangrovimicrobium sediminis]|uniref:ABC transporter permease n=1 Tax=Mangrovimicrobium sediminis TaxID=2562682 RepID=A0A4Z0LX86_9GAMM|nr:FtsX-like permease family protein [Haliea sp. SAOS-164]TGD71844.1 ABC transporter permease [Haliea sp. SAOS-164]
MSGALAVSARLAWRNLWRNHRRTLIMLAAISIGVWAMIFMSALMRGMTDQMVRNGLRTLPGEVQVHAPGYRDDPSVANSMAWPQGALLSALQQPPVQAWSARVRVPAMIASERESRGVTLLGVDPASERALGSAPHADEISEGRFLEGPGDDGIVLGAALARKLDTGLGKRVVIMSQDPQNNVADRGMRVVGLFRARLEGTEELYAYTGRQPLQALLNIGDEISEVAASAGDYRHTARWAPALVSAAGPQLEVKTWRELDPYLGTMLRVQDGFSLIFMVVIFAVLSFGLVNTLAMAVFERVREIGLMQALGMRPGAILRLLLLESLYLLLLSLVAGNLAAWLTIKPLERGIDLSIVAEGMAMMGLGTTLYPALAWSDMLFSTAVVVLLGVLASLLPAWRAARLDPVQAINQV